MKRILTLTFALLACFAFNLSHADEPEPETPAAVHIEPHVLATPAAAHPQVLVKSINPGELTVCFDWLDAEGQPVDSGNSIAPYTPADDTAPPLDSELIAAITAVAPAE